MTANAPHKTHPMYGWALDSLGFPVSIAEAQKGERYVCPVCGSEMVAKKGEINQHHFAHVNLMQCTPERVAGAVAKRWLAEKLRKCQASGDPVIVHWKTHNDQEKYAINILKDIAQVEQDRMMFGKPSDIALIDARDAERVVILIPAEAQPTVEEITKLVESRVMVLVLDAVSVRSGQMDLQQLLDDSKIWGGWWGVDSTKFPDGLVTDPEKIRTLIQKAVSKPPYCIYGELRQEGVMSHLLDVEGHILWLPLEVWQNIIGGSRNSLGSGVIILSQEWEQPDQSRIALFYVTVRDASAVAIRYFPPGHTVRYDLGTAAFRLTSTNALDLARKLVGGPETFPQ